MSLDGLELQEDYDAIIAKKGPPQRVVAGTASMFINGEKMENAVNKAVYGTTSLDFVDRKLAFVTGEQATVDFKKTIINGSSAFHVLFIIGDIPRVDFDFFNASDLKGPPISVSWTYVDLGLIVDFGRRLSTVEGMSLSLSVRRKSKR